MSRDQFWLTKAQFSKIKPHLPTDTRGKAPPEGLPTRRDPLRPQCRELPRRSLHRGRRQLLVMSLDPSHANLKFAA